MTGSLAQEVETFGHQHVVEKCPHALLDAWRAEHAQKFVLQPVRRMQSTGLRRIEQGAVRRRIPQEEAQPRSLGGAVQPPLPGVRGIRFGDFPDV